MSNGKNIGSKQKGMIGLAIMFVFSAAVIFGTDTIDRKIAAVEANKEISVTGNYTDGTYKAEEPEFDGKGYKGIVTMEVKSGGITALTWDAIDKEGNYKSKLSMDGKYVMTETNPKWHEQAKALVANVLENQSVEKITMDAEGKTDAVATVSISVDGFVNLVENCLVQATK